MNSYKGRAVYCKAVGLDYNGRHGFAPSVGVKGELLVADEVVRLARRFGIPVVERAELARALHHLEIDQEIPEELYEVVAVLINHIEKRGKSSFSDYFPQKFKNRHSMQS